MWVKPSTAKPKAENVRSMAQLIPGDVFSINEKSKKFAFVKMSNDGQVVAQPVMPGGPNVMMPIPAQGDADVMVWDKPKEEESLLREYCSYDRVCLRNTMVEGTVLDVNADKFPDIDVIVLWDQPMHGQVMTEVHPHEIEYRGARATGDSYSIAKESREFLKNMQDQHKKDFKEQIKQDIANSAAAKVQAKNVMQEKINMSHLRQVATAADATINAFASDFKMIVDVGILRITSGPSDYEVDEIPGIVNDHAETIYAKVGTVTSDNNLKPSVTAEVMKRIASSIFDTYSLIRQSYIRKHKGGWGVFSEKGRLLGKHKVKQSAVKQLRAIEWSKKHKG